jgi:hypothetical protein
LKPSLRRSPLLQLPCLPHVAVRFGDEVAPVSNGMGLLRSAALRTAGVRRPSPNG